MYKKITYKGISKIVKVPQGIEMVNVDFNGEALIQFNDKLELTGLAIDGYGNKLIVKSDDVHIALITMGAVLDCAIEVSEKTESDVFLNYFGFIDGVNLEISPDGNGVTIPYDNTIYIRNFTPIQIHELASQMIAWIDENKKEGIRICSTK